MKIFAFRVYHRFQQRIKVEPFPNGQRDGEDSPAGIDHYEINTDFINS